MTTRGKLTELEALRGIAALVVLLHHTMLGFTPQLHGLTYPDQPITLFGTPAYAMVNGSAAVIVFFVLSGYVLSLNVLRSGSAPLAASSALKRWPRLAGPVILTNLMAGLVMAGPGFTNREAAAAVPSVWLGWFYTWPSAGWMEIPHSLWEGATTFITGQSFYNSNLWTMVYEFAGSFLVLASALMVAKLPWGRWTCLAGIGLGTLWLSPYLLPFIVGVALALRDRTPHPDWSGVQIGLALALVVLFGGYNENIMSRRPEGLYSVLGPVAAIDPLRLRLILHTLMAGMVLLLFRRATSLRKVMSGRVGRTLGFLSFGIYLCQVPVICSVSSLTYLALEGQGRVLQIGVTFAVTFAGTVAVAVPVAMFDHWWVRQVGRALSVGQGRRDP